MLTPELLRKIRRIELRTRRLVQDSFAGEYLSVFKGQGMEFDEVRPYVAGDEVRNIDWNVTARAGEPYVKRYREERELTVLLVVDASASGNFGSVGRFKRELAAELTAVLAFAATSNKDKVGLLIFTDEVELFVEPRKGRKHVLRMVSQLLSFQPRGRGTDLANALDDVNRSSIIFVISDFLDNPDSYRRALSVTRRRHDVIAVDLEDPMEREIGDVGLLALEDAESGEIVWVDSSSKAWRAQFAQQNGRFATAKTKLFQRTGVDHIQISTGKDYVNELLRFFARRARRLRR